MVAASAPGAWTDEHAKLEVAIKGVEMDTTLRALEGNALLPDEMTHDVRVAKEIFDIKRELNDRELKLKKQRGKRATTPGGPVAFSGLNVYVGDTDLSDDLRSKLVAANARIVSTGDPANQVNSAQVYLVRNVSDPLSTVLFSAVLSGGIVASTREVYGDGGPVDAFIPCVESRRAVWISTDFGHANAHLLSIYRNAVSRRSSKWVTITTFAEFVDRVTVDAGRPARQRRPMETVGLVSDAEKAAGFQDVRNVFDTRGFLEFMQQRDEGLCRAGACGL